MTVDTGTCHSAIVSKQALKHKDEAWGVPDEDMYNVGASWGDDF